MCIYPISISTIARPCPFLGKPNLQNRHKTNMVDNPESSNAFSSLSVKRKKYDTEFNKEWIKDCPIQTVCGNKNAFFCIPCQKTISCSHQGKLDVERHCSNSTHNKNAKAIKESRKISSMFSSPSSSTNEAVAKAEVLHTNFIVHHNTSFKTADHLNCLYAKMFPDSNIAKKFASATCILNKAIMPSLQDYIVAYMKTNPFPLVNDGSSDTGISKMNSACALIFDINNSDKV